MENIKNKIITLLHWSEKYAKTDMVYLAKGGSWLGLGQIVATGAAFFTSIAFANLLPPETYGVYKYILSVTNIILVSTLTGMDTAVIQSIARGFESSLPLGVKTKMKWGVLGTIASLFIAGYYYTQGNVELALAFCIVSIFVPFSESFDMYNALLWGKKLFSVQTKYNIIRKLLSLIAIIATLLLTKNIFIILSVYFLTLVIPAGLFLWHIIKKNLSNRKIDPETILYGKQLSAIYIIGLVVGELDKILVFHYLCAINLAIYALAVAPTDQIKGLFKSLNTLAFPQFALRNSEEIKRTIRHKVWVLALAIGVIVLAYIIATPVLFSLFFPKYLASIHYSQILESQRDKMGIYRFNLHINIFSIIILLPLIYYFGIWGAVISRIISRSFTLGASVWSIKRLKSF